MNESHSQNIIFYSHLGEMVYKKNHMRTWTASHIMKKSNAHQIMGAQGTMSRCFATNVSNKTLICYACTWMPTFTCTNIHWAGRKNYMLGASPAGPGRAFNRGWRALTTMLMFGRKSASYCTHKAATAAICNEDKMSSTAAL